MKKLIFALCVFIAPALRLHAQNTDSSRIEIGVQTFAFPSYIATVLDRTTFFNGWDKTRSFKMSVGIDARYRLDAHTSLRLAVGYGMENYHVEDTSGSSFPQGNLRSYNYELKHRVLMFMAGVEHTHWFGRLGVFAGPELVYYQSLSLNEKSVVENSTTGVAGVTKAVTEVENKTPSQHHFGAGFYLGLHYALCRNFVVSGELHQMYLSSFVRGTNSSHHLVTNYQNGEQTGTLFDYERKREINDSNSGFQVAMPTISVRYCW